MITVPVGFIKKCGMFTGLGIMVLFDSESRGCFRKGFLMHLSGKAAAVSGYLFVAGMELD